METRLNAGLLNRREAFSTPPGISVVILTCNRLPKLRAVVASLMPQLGPSDEVFIVDTGSTDGTREWLATLSHPVNHLFLDPAYLDFAAARNAALTRVHGACIAFLDDDCIPSFAWLKTLREELQRTEVIGGLVLPYFLYAYPAGWSSEIAWCAGMSPRGLIDKRDDNYPATANLAAHRSVFANHPFQEINGASLVTEQKYKAGREDAQWWKEIRRSGARTCVSPRLVVFHAIPDSRFSFRNLIARAKHDGIAAWLREPNTQQAHVETEGLIDQFAHDLVHRRRVIAGGLPALAQRFVWYYRQLAYLGSARHESEPRVFLRLSPRIIKRSARRLVGETRLRLIKKTRAPLRVPDPPHHILIAAPTYLGDTVLLLPIVELLQSNWPEANILVWTRFPELFSPTSPLITIVRADESSEELVASFARWSSEINFVPYYHFGPAKLWRTVLSLRGITFTHDVGFGKEADYYYAGRRIEKRFDQHEVLNLLEMVSLWPLAGSLRPARLTPTQRYVESLLRRYPHLQDAPYLTIHIDTALEMKRWPLERWEYLAQCLLEETDLSICFIGTEQARAASQELAHRLSPRRCLDCTGLSVGELGALLSGARMAVGPCSGPKHIAYATRTPTFTLYGAVSEHRWGAWHDTELHAYIRSTVEYLSPREQRGLPENHAMLMISAQDVAQGVLEHYQRVKHLSCSEILSG